MAESLGVGRSKWNLENRFRDWPCITQENWICSEQQWYYEGGHVWKCPAPVPLPDP